MRLYISTNTTSSETETITEMEYINVSTSNNKMGHTIPSFSTPSVLTCPKNLPCFKGCYAHAYELHRPNVKNSYLQNLKMLKKYPAKVAKAIIGYINLLGCRYFRFSVAGDVEVDGMKYINVILMVAKSCPNCSFLLFTKSDKWNDIDPIPANLHIIYSNWGKWSIPNYVHNFPTSNVYHDGDDMTGKIVCPNSIDEKVKCENCHLCWKLTKPITVWFKAHGIHKNDA